MFPNLSTNRTEDAPPIIPLRDFFRNPQKTGYQLSPSGDFIGFLQPVGSRLNIFVRLKEGGEEKQITAVADRDIQNFLWKGNKYLIYLKDDGGDENYHLHVTQIDSVGQRDLTPFSGVRAEIIDDLEDHPTDLLIGLNKRNQQIFDAYRLNVETGQLKLVAENPGNIASWTADHEGNIRVATTTDGVNTSLLYRKTENDPWKSVITTNFKESFAPQFFSFDNKALFGISNIGRDKVAVVEFDPESGKETVVLFERPDVDVSGLNFSKKRKVLTSATYTTWKEERHFFDPVSKEVFETLGRNLPGCEIYIVSSDKEEVTFIVRTISDRSLGAFYLYDTRSGALSKIADRNPWLKEADLAEMKPIEYTARDGLVIHGYLTLPRGKAANRLPIVVHPHGGPWHRDVWAFDPVVQFLANRGFGILQMNFRGSTGYGRRFWEAGFRQWGQRMQDDITDGVQWLINRGIADPQRIAIYGGSYGGYAVLAGLTKTPDLYAAGVDFVGVSNIFTFLNTIPPYWKPYLDMMYEMVGNPETDRALLQENSPALNAAKIKAPLFVAQGAKDPRVNINESEQIVDALRKRGIDVEYMVREDEGHGFKNEENRFAFYEAMEKFLEKHL
ncbi:MAG TPA: S9 family peptidase [Chthoniobacterales bacterium]|jgi:dipeptidyl aminopeptidase/acylaminoacyl peptidase|nr:S9 family peptidase [Chthoniobacterales bacterium]